MWELLQRFFSSAFSFCKIKGYFLWKYKFYRLYVRKPASGLLQIGQKSKKWQWCCYLSTRRHRQSFWRCFVSLDKFSYWSKFHVNIITDPGVMTIFCYKGWPEIRKLEIPPSEFFPISEDWGKLAIPNLARMSLMKCYWMLQNVKVTAFIVSKLLRENQQGRQNYPNPTRLELTNSLLKHLLINLQLFTKYLGLTLVSMWNRALREKFNFCFSRVFC